MRATVARVYLGNLRHNFRLIKKITGGARVLASVKADAYGHGAVPVARVLADEGCDWLGVATVEEARELREGGILLPILLLGLALPEESPLIPKYGLSATVADKDYLAILGQAANDVRQKLGFHLKVDTGMGRLGCQPSEALEILNYASKFPYLRLEGVMTHYPSSDNGLHEPTGSQSRQFLDLARELRAQGHVLPLVHSANSGAVLYHPATHVDMVRPGILLYGYVPNRELPDTLGFRPVMELESRVMFLKDVKAGTPLSYGSTYITPKDGRVATIGAGYGDGYFRSFSNKAAVRISNHQFMVSGRVCMDQFVVDLGTDTSVKRWDKVGLFGPYRSGPTAWDLAGIAQTIPYEITCAVSRRVPRLYTEEGGFF